MMVALFVCGLQITCISLLTLFSVRILLARAPQLASQLCLVGIFLCGATVAITFWDAPRPWVFRNQALTSASAPLTLHPERATNGSLAFPLEASVQLSDLLQSFSDFRTQRPLLESRLERFSRWLVGLVIGLALLRCLLGTLSLWRLVRSSQICQNTQLHSESVALQSLSSHPGVPALRFSHRVLSPCVCWLKPRTIFLPLDFASWSPLERKTALAHEMHHLCRRDALWRLLADMVLATFSLHPFAFFLRKELIAAQELATDVQATEAFASTEQYRKGLSMLALRMDSQRSSPMFLEVSVSTNSMVRRIKMLNKNYRPLTIWQGWCARLCLIGLAALSLAWTAKADDPAPDDPIRLAARNSNSSSIRESAFQGPSIQPSLEIGSHSGYISLLPNALAKSAMWSQTWEQLSALEEFSGTDLSASGLTLENLEKIVTNLNLIVRKIPEENRNASGDRFYSTIGVTSTCVRSTAPIDWNAIWLSVVKQNLPGNLDQNALSHLSQFFEELDRSTELRLTPDESETPSDAQWSVLKQTMAGCDGGIFLAGSLLPQEAFTEVARELKPEDDKMQVLPWLSKTLAIAVGIDLDMNQQHKVRICFTPSDELSSDEFAQRLGVCVEHCCNAIDAVAQAKQSEPLAAIARRLRAGESSLDAQTPQVTLQFSLDAESVQELLGLAMAR